MNAPKSGQTVAVLGASPKPERYSHTAMKLLDEYGHRAIPVNPAFETILGQKCYPNLATVPPPIDTITLYLCEARSTPLIDEIISAKPRRIIINPGAENARLAERATQSGIEVVEGCTLVMLRAGLF